MTIFILVTLVLLVICLWSLAPALLNRKSLNRVDIKQQNLEVARYRLQQLEQDGAGEQDELEASLLDDLSGPDYDPAVDRPTGRLVAALILFAIPLFAALLYSALGNFNWLQPPQPPLPSAEQIRADPASNIQVLLDQLEQKLQQDPENADGWALAGRTYMSLGQFNKAEQAYARVHQIVGDDPDILTAWADASLMVNDNQFSDEIAGRISRALELDPNQVNALWIAAMGAGNRGQNELALSYITRLRPLLAGNSEAENQLDIISKQLSAETSVNNDSNASGTEPAEPSVSDHRITIELSVAEKLTTDLPGNTRVFVFAKALNGPPFPLAAARLQLADLPTTVHLDDSMGMVPGQVLSSVEQVLVTARVSRSGEPSAAPGDLTSLTKQAATSGKPLLQLRIDQIVE